MPIYQFFTFKQQIPKFSQDSLPYSIIFPNHWKLMVYCCKLWEKCNSHEKQYCYFLGVKSIPWNDMYYKIIQTLNSKKQLKKGSTLIGNWSINNNVALWSFLCQNWFFQTWTFPSLFYLFNFIFSELYHIFKKTGYFFADIEIFTIAYDVFEHVQIRLYFLKPVVSKAAILPRTCCQ